jgi:hypothetical protein
MMNPKFLSALKHWAYHLFRASLQGGALAVKAFFATAGANAALPSLKIGTLSLRESLGVFAVSAAYSAWDYLSANPMPDDEEEGTQSGAANLQKTENLIGQIEQQLK